MSAKTTIEWATRTWNPVRGCSRVSPGCDNCYAMKFAHRFAGAGKPYEGLTTIRRGKVDWSGSARIVPGEILSPLDWKDPERIFVNSMSDLFHHSITNEEIATLFGVMAAAPAHRFLVLTKRPERALEFFDWLAKEGATLPSLVGAQPGPGESLLTAAAVMYADQRTDYALSRDYRDPRKARLFIDAVQSPWPLPNVWLGVSVEDQRRADERIPTLLRCPAAVRFLSCEPLLGQLDLAPYLHRGEHQVCPRCLFSTNTPLEACPNDGAGLGPEVAIDWVIVGGESGPGARSMYLSWMSGIVAQCRAARVPVPVFCKQFGSDPIPEHGVRLPKLRNRKGGDLTEIPGEWPREFPQ